MTVVCAVAVLLALDGSPGEVDETVTVFVTVPFAVGTTMIVTVADAPAARLPSAHVSVWFFDVGEVQVPCVVLTPRNETFAGIGSLNDTPLAPDGPRFVTGTV